MIIKDISIKYKLPTTWNDINLKQFNQLFKVNELNKELKEDEMDKVLDNTVEFIHTLTGFDKEFIYNLETEKVKDLSVILLKLTNSSFNKVEDELIEIDGNLYKFDKDVTKMSFGQFVDLEHMTKDKNNVWEVAHYIAASFIRPVTKCNKLLNKGKKLFKVKLNSNSYQVEKYNSNTFVGRANLFYEKLGMDYISTTTDFFLTLGNHLQNRIVDSSQSK